MSENIKYVFKHEELGYIKDSNMWTDLEDKFTQNIEDAKTYSSKKVAEKVIINMVDFYNEYLYKHNNDVLLDKTKMKCVKISIQTFIVETYESSEFFPIS